jgi:hypothetical protein
MDIFEILGPFGTFCVDLVHFSSLGISHEEKSGNPGWNGHVTICEFGKGFVLSVFSYVKVCLCGLWFLCPAVSRCMMPRDKIRPILPMCRTAWRDMTRQDFIVHVNRPLIKYNYVSGSSCLLPNSITLHFRAGLPDFLGTTYQNGGKISNDHKMAITHTK